MCFLVVSVALVVFTSLYQNSFIGRVLLYLTAVVDGAYAGNDKLLLWRRISCIVWHSGIVHEKTQITMELKLNMNFNIFNYN